MKFIVTGGHFTPAYSFIQHALSQADQIVFVGVLGKKSPENQEITNLGIPYHQIFPVKYNRINRLSSLLKLPLLLVPVFQSLILILRSKPDRIVGFGSFVALPMAIAGKIMGIPVYLHEQTRALGLANRIIDRFARGSAVSYPETLSSLVSTNKICTGNLLRAEIWSFPSKPSFTLDSRQPFLFVTGGNQGSSILLETIKPILDILTTKYQLIVQHGKNRFSKPKNGSCIAKQWFTARDMAWLIQKARIILTRGGANTTAEIMAVGTPSIIVPLPHAAQDEQTKNAEIITQANAGLIIPESAFSPESLLHALSQIENNYLRYSDSAHQLAALQNPNAASQFYQFVTS